jgi:hypothetical protein
MIDVLPAPFAPIIPAFWPALMRNETSRSTSRWP